MSPSVAASSRLPTAGSPHARVPEIVLRREPSRRATTHAESPTGPVVDTPRRGRPRASRSLAPRGGRGSPDPQSGAETSHSCGIGLAEHLDRRAGGRVEEKQVNLPDRCCTVCGMRQCSREYPRDPESDDPYWRGADGPPGVGDVLDDDGMDLLERRSCECQYFGWGVLGGSTDERLCRCRRRVIDRDAKNRRLPTPDRSRPAGQPPSSDCAFGPAGT